MPNTCYPVPTVYEFGVEVRAPGGAAQATYIQSINRSEMDGRHIDNSDAIEVEGIARIWTLGGKAFIGERNAPLLHKYDVADNGTMTEAEFSPISFADSGASRIEIANVLVSPTKAYFMWNATLTGVVYNPTEMAIDDTFDLSPAELPGYEGNTFLQGTFLFEHAVHGNRAFVSTLYSINADMNYKDTMTVTVFDTDADRVLKVIEDDRCYGPSTMVKADNGDIYVSSYSFTGRPYQVEGFVYKPTCILRILAGQDEFDPNYFVTFPELLGGNECTRWYPVNGRYSYCMAMPLEALASSANLSQTPGELWKIDLLNRTGEPVDGVPDTGSPFATLGYPDSHDTLVIGFPDVAGAFDRSTVFRLDPATDSVTPVMRVDGLFRGFYIVR